MKKRSEHRNTTTSATMLVALFAVPFSIPFVAGCGGGGEGNKASAITTPVANPTPSQTPVQSSLDGRSYSVVVSLGESGQQFVASLQIGANSTIAGRAKMIGTSDQDGYTDLAGQVNVSPSSAAVLIEGDYIFLEESNLSPAGLAAPAGPARKIRLSGLLGDTIGQVTEITLLLNGLEYKGTLTLDSMGSPSVPVTPASPVAPPTSPPTTPTVPTVDPVGTWNLVEGQLEWYDIPGTFIEIRADKTYLVSVPAAYDAGEMIDGRKEFTGTWRGENGTFVFDMTLAKDDTDFDGIFQGEEIMEDDYPDDHVFTLTQSGNEMRFSNDDGTARVDRRK